MANEAAKLPRNVLRQLGHYVYLYVDPKTRKVFYVGKGIGSRAFDHIKGPTEVEILMHGLRDSKAAHAVETAAIDLLGLEHLDNNVRGHKCHKQGRMTLDQILSLYQRKPAKITEPAVLIRINKLYRYGMDPVDLYDATRGVWRIKANGKNAQYAMAVYEGIVREVYKINQWLPSGSTFSTRHPYGLKIKGRYEFVGTVASEKIRRKYIDRSVDGYFARHSQNPIRYVNC